MSLLDGLISYYNFDSGTGTTLVDVHGSNNGSISGASWSSSSKIGPYSLNFDGSNDYVNTNNNDNYGEFSVSLWVKADSRDFVPISKYEFQSSNRVWAIGLGVGGNDKFQIYTSSSGSSVDLVESTATWNTGEWYHLVFVWKNSSYRKLYVNNNLVIDDSITYDINTNTRDIYLGGWWYGSNFQRPFDGLIDEVAIYNRIISSSEVSELHNNGDGLAYPFDTFSVTTLSATDITKNSVTLNGEVEL